MTDKPKDKTVLLGADVDLIAMILDLVSVGTAQMTALKILQRSSSMAEADQKLYEAALNKMSKAQDRVLERARALVEPYRGGPTDV
jgi:hypothetical protein